MKTFALSALIAFAAMPALAQTKVHPVEYYVIRDSATKTCAVVEDGDPLDVLIIHEAKTFPGVVMRCKPIASSRSTRRGKATRSGTTACFNDLANLNACRSG